MISKGLLLRLFDAAYMQRWNDRLRPVQMYELDKQAHKMVVAFYLGKFEERTEGFDWVEVIEGGFFEYLQRVVLTDLKPPVYYKIRADKAKYKELNEYVYASLSSLLSPLGHGFDERFRSYFQDHSGASANINRRILSAAHFYASDWEFRMLERANPDGYDMQSIRADLDKQKSLYRGLAGMEHLERERRYRDFIGLCGELRFQVRWSNIHRIPMTSVLGHMLFVAMLSYLFSLEAEVCRVGSVNNYFTGLFHDLPEALTRDIILPVKRAVSGLRGLIKDIEKEYMDREVYGLLPPEWCDEMRLYVEDEFSNSTLVRGERKEITPRELLGRYNKDRYSPRAGQLVRAADRLAAFVEGGQALQKGSQRQELFDACAGIAAGYKEVSIGTLDLGSTYAVFGREQRRQR